MSTIKDILKRAKLKSQQDMKVDKMVRHRQRERSYHEKPSERMESYSGAYDLKWNAEADKEIRDRMKKRETFNKSPYAGFSNIKKKYRENKYREDRR